MSDNWIRSASRASLDIASEVGAAIPKEYDLKPEAPATEEKPEPSPSPVADQEPAKRNIALELFDRALRKIDERADEGKSEDESKAGRAKKKALRAVAVFSSGSCMVASVYFSFKGLVGSQPAPIAAIMALTVVSTLSVAPELAVSLMHKRKALTAIIVAAISVVATVFSMSQTVQGVYDARTQKIEEEATESRDSLAGDAERRAASSRAIVLQERRERLSKSLETEQGAVANYQAEIDKRIASGESPESRAIRTLVANRNASRLRIAGTKEEPGLEVQIQAAEEELAAISSLAITGEGEEAIAGSSRRKSFAGWLGDRFGITEDQMEFALSVFPALFIDIIAPTMLVVAFSL